MHSKRSWRWYVNAALFAIADWCMEMGAKVSQWEPPSEAELEQSSMRVMAMFHSRRDSPCPNCDGRGLVMLDDEDTAVCEVCRGHGVKLEVDNVPRAD